MHTLKKSLAALAACSLAAVCYGDDYSGAYRLHGKNTQVKIVLNVHGDQAEMVRWQTNPARITTVQQMKAISVGDKLLIDDADGNRLALGRNADERSLDCLNCNAIDLPKGTVWDYDPKGPYDVLKLLKEQAAMDGAVRELAAQAAVEKATELAQREVEAPKLGPYEGEWVYQRVSSLDPLSIMTIWRKSQIKQWSFNFLSLDRLSQGTPLFAITEAGLRIGAGAKSHLYTLSADKKTLACADCATVERWAKSDPKKDLSDRYYARSVAGNPL